MYMLFDKIILFVCCSVLMFVQQSDSSFAVVLAFTLALCFLLLTSYLNPYSESHISFSTKPAFHLFLAAYLILCLFIPLLFFYLPLLFYDICNTNNIWLYIAGLLFCLGWMHELSLLYFLILAFLYALAILLHSRSYKICHLTQQLKELRDNSTEYNLMLSRKNHDLLEKQDYEIHLATLNERNRIAREIHDNVGHMLSRSILQVGALCAINSSETLTAPLNALKETLLGAMNSIRTSVHDLHDDSIDLKASIELMLRDYTDYHITLDYDMGQILPRNVKYCYISIVKEALSNIVKHSNASRIQITLREHPSLYQLLIQDNGTNIHVNSAGIGLESMQERIHALYGTFYYQTDDGFRIFASIPKTENDCE